MSMIKVKIEKNRLNEPIFKLGFKKLNDKEERFLKRALLEGKAIRGRYNYEVPIRFFEPIFKNLKLEEINLDKKSIVKYFEFSDEYDERYYYKTEVNAKYMKKWREEGCPNIFKIEINKDTLEIKKEIIFKKIERVYV